MLERPTRFRGRSWVFLIVGGEGRKRREMRKNEGKREMEKESSCHNNNHNRIYVK